MSKTRLWLSIPVAILAATLPCAILPAAEADSNREAGADPVRIPALPAEAIRFQVTGPFQSDEVKAYQSALELARDRMIRGLREKKPHLSFQQRLTLPLVERYVVKNSTQTEYLKPPIDKVMYATTLELELRRQDQEDLYKLMRQEEAQSRQAWLVQGYVLTVLALLLSAGYFRLEERTRGYYTYWLRMGAVLVFVCAVTVLVYFNRFYSAVGP